MPVFSAIRQTEAWSGASILLGLALLIAVIGLIVWQMRRFIHGSRRR